MTHEVVEGKIEEEERRMHKTMVQRNDIPNCVNFPEFFKIGNMLDKAISIVFRKLISINFLYSNKKRYFDECKEDGGERRGHLSSAQDEKKQLKTAADNRSQDDSIDSNSESEHKSYESKIEPPERKRDRQVDCEACVGSHDRCPGSWNVASFILALLDAGVFNLSLPPTVLSLIG
ncbi:hypothetical protein KSS87_009486 [Heliosperma pusillum]|nr:hypothetical protein KSS87_009486 [Heliosperma pusillum]